ncbi:MAG: NADH-quinone oxidoreductase subunit J [Bdellovibrionaceae bacterium]|nr:NADH-quinone oxidoreductase subunit J [Pseudobdellovibrionaceae bacterium]
MTDIILFYFLATMTVLTGVGVVMSENPLFSALYLVLSMTGVAGLFFLLQAPFVGAVQILVYAGAVMVLFVLVIMLIDINKSGEKYIGGNAAALFKGLAIGIFSGLVSAVVLRSPIVAKPALSNGSYTVLEIAKVLFTKYVLAFELLGIILLVIPIGVVALSRIKGGTHER